MSQSQFNVGDRVQVVKTISLASFSMNKFLKDQQEEVGVGNVGHIVESYEDRGRQVGFTVKWSADRVPHGRTLICADFSHVRKIGR